MGDHGEVLAPTYEHVIDKINEIIKFTDQRTKDRNDQVRNLQVEIRSIRHDLMKYHNLLLKQTSVIQMATEATRDSQKLYEYLSINLAKDLKKIKKRLKI